MGMAQWLIGFAEGWDTGIPGFAIPAACSDSGPVTDIVMFTTATDLGVGLSTDGTSGDPWAATPNASVRISATDGWVSKSLYDPTLEQPWDGSDPLVVTAGQPLWIGLDTGTQIDTTMLYFAVLIDSSGGGPPAPSAVSVGAGVQASGARIVGFTG